MRIHRAIAFVCGFLLLLALFIATAQSAIGRDPEATAEAIQTQIANLEVTLTAIADESGTPEAGNVTVEDRGFTYTFTSAERVESLDAFSDPPRGVFVVVHFTALNNGNRPALLPAVQFTVGDEGVFALTDGKGRQLSPDFTAMVRLLIESETFGDLQPGIEYETAVVFDIPKDATDLVLTLPGTDLEYDLPLDES